MVAQRAAQGAPFSGPYLALMNHPQLCKRVEDLGYFLKFDGHLSREAYQFVVLCVARATGAAFEWDDHVAHARALHIPDDVIAGVVVEGLTKRYGSVTAVDRLDLTVAQGEFVVLLGPSGCGKTTTLRCIAGLEEVSDGRISMGGEVVSSAQHAVPPERRSIGMVFQSYAVWPHMTVEQNVAFGLRLKKLPGDEVRRRVAAVLELVGLGALGERGVSQLSGGQQQRVALARAIVLEPKVLLFDEPLSNLDAKLRERMRFELRSLQQRLGITSVYVTHDQQEAMVIGDHIIVMDGGRIAQQGTPHELYETPASRFLADFIGDANLVDGELALLADGATFAAGGVAVPVRAGGLAAGPATLAVRPQRLTLTAPGQGPLPGTCKRVAYLGSRIEYMVDTPWGELLVFDGDARHARARGESVAVTFEQDAVILLAR
jgi:iron(III) transport system ATP-binding protein